jgi:hypothetical protein
MPHTLMPNQGRLRLNNTEVRVFSSCSERGGRAQSNTNNCNNRFNNPAFHRISAKPINRVIYLLSGRQASVQRSPFAVHRSPFAVHRSPFTVRRSPFAVHRSPFTVRRSPFTGQCPEFRSLLTTDTDTDHLRFGGRIGVSAFGHREFCILPPGS